MGGMLRNNLAKFSTETGMIDFAWKPGLSVIALNQRLRWPVASLVVNSQGDLFIGGQFSGVGGLARNGVAKVASAGTGIVDANWDPHLNGELTALFVGPDDSVMVGGTFASVGGVVRAALAGFANPDIVFFSGFE
jgi:hypothetical protein